MSSLISSASYSNQPSLKLSINSDSEYIYSAYYNNISSTTPEKSIVQELETYGFPSEVNHRADSFFKRYDRIHRKGPRRAMIAFCLYLAHRDLTIPMIPEIIADRLGINVKSIQVASHDYKIQLQGECTTHYQVSLTEIVELIANYVQELYPDREQLIKFTSHIEQSHQQEISRINKKPQYIAVAIILYYLETSGKLNSGYRSRLSNLISLTSNTLDSITNRIKEIDN